MLSDGEVSSAKDSGTGGYAAVASRDSKSGMQERYQVSKPPFEIPLKFCGQALKLVYYLVIV